MSLRCGIVGLPNVGKSTLFNALTAAGAEAANYPFCTIDPNVGMVNVPDDRLDRLAQIFSSQKTIPTAIEFVDIAGLVAGASKGEGLGNQFLAHIRETDAIVHVVRCFDDPNIVHVAGSVEPLRDIEVIETELILSDMDTVEKRVQKLEKQAKSGASKDAIIELELLKRVDDLLAKGKPARNMEKTEEDEKILGSFGLLTSKPVLYLCNVSDEDFQKGGNPWVESVQKLAAAEDHKSVMICGSIESELSQLTHDEQLEFLESMGAKESGLTRLIKESYALLDLITYFTAGPKEAHAWTITKGTRAPQAAGKIHTDFEKGFIRAETYNSKDLFDLGSEAAVRDKGKYRSEGKEYIVIDGDIMLFRFNV